MLLKKNYELHEGCPVVRVAGGAQGDIFIRRVDSLPVGLKQRKSEGPRAIIAHSETGHHHWMPSSDVTVLEGPNPRVFYLDVKTKITKLFHDRANATHKTVAFKEGLYEVRRQREYIDEGERMVMD